MKEDFPEPRTGDYLLAYVLFVAVGFGWLFWGCGEVRAETGYWCQTCDVRGCEYWASDRNASNADLRTVCVEKDKPYRCTEGQVPEGDHCVDKDVSQKNTYMLYTRSHGGTVSLNKGLTQEECKRAIERAYAWRSLTMGDRWKDIVQPGDIVTAECFNMAVEQEK